MKKKIHRPTGKEKLTNAQRLLDMDKETKNIKSTGSYYREHANSPFCLIARVLLAGLFFLLLYNVNIVVAFLTATFMFCLISLDGEEDF